MYYLLAINSFEKYYYNYIRTNKNFLFYFILFFLENKFFTKFAKSSPNLGKIQTFLEIKFFFNLLLAHILVSLC